MDNQDSVAEALSQAGQPTTVTPEQNTLELLRITPQLNSDYFRYDDKGSWQVDVRRLFSDAIGGRQQITGGDLRTQVCQLCNIRSWKFYNSLLDQAVNDRVLVKSYDQAAHVIYALRPQEPVQTELYKDGAPF